jgi:hypothetical protein
MLAFNLTRAAVSLAGGELVRATTQQCAAN